MAEENVSGPTGSSSDVDENKAIAAIGYLGILFLVPLLVKKDSPFAQYHAKQGMILFIADVILWFVAFIIGVATLGIGFYLSWIIWLLIIVWTILGIVNALNGKMQPLPIIGKMAESWKI